MKTLSPKTIRIEKIESSNYLSLEKLADSTRAVGVFSHYRDAKVALEELGEAEFSLNEITLIARNCWRYRWQSELTICDRFAKESFGSNQIAQHFFQRLFRSGKYLLLVTGKEDYVNSVGAIIGRRQGHSKVWYV